MTSGNLMVDRGGKGEFEWTCSRCKGNGSIPWKALPEWRYLMACEIDFQITDIRQSYKIIGIEDEFTFNDMLDIAREVRRNGFECVSCGGRGVI